jgi:hypothetical protein
MKIPILSSFWVSICSLFRTFYAILFRSKRFYCCIDWGGDIVFKLWECPGKWLTPTALDVLRHDLQAIAHLAQGEKALPVYGVLGENQEDLNNRVITIGYDKRTKQPIGFAAQAWLDVVIDEKKPINVLHLGLVYVAQNYQKKAIVGLLYILPNILLLFKRGFRPLWISNVSQVPCVVGVVADYYSQVYPNPLHFSKQRRIHCELGQAVFNDHKNVFGTGDEAIYDTQRQIIYNSYTGGSDNLKKSFEECPKHRVAAVNTFCNAHLNYERGDDFLQIGVLSTHLIYTFFKKKVITFFSTSLLSK